MKTKSIKPIEEVLRAGNDGKNQRIKGDFVGKHVYCNVGTLVEYCLLMSEHNSQAPISYDEIENLYTYPEYRARYAKFEGGTDDERQVEIDRLTDLMEESGTDVDAIQDEINELEDLESEPQEIFEWWAVSSFLFEQLKEMGHPVVDAGSCYVWGRCTSGQAILLDYAITKICADMGILEGQENEW